tara:strand:- start:44 stop:283 length:240 start_codon:yes stop_codon:yes gene_type:complete
MLQIEKFFKSKEGIKIFSVLLGLGVAGLFKMSCDSRSCLVFKGPEFNDDNKTIRYNGKCYNVQEKMMDCKDNTKDRIYL